ncbi:MAG: hypothetical protein NTX42_04740 [Methanothrix sp.]|nr:hypothetical protein [Methanothrix sp.]
MPGLTSGHEIFKFEWDSEEKESEEMKEPNKNNTRFKGKYKDVFLVFAVLMITGVLLAVSAYAQLDQQPPGASGLGDFSTQDNMGTASSNQPPTLTALESDKSSPQEAGSSIKWTAKAADPENDPMSFIFLLKGPSTRDVWKPVNQDPSDNTWIWVTNSEDAGNYQISVSVRDEMHAGPQFTPDEKISDVFTLTAVEPLPVVTAQEQTYVPSVQEQPAKTQTLAPSQEVIPANLAPVMTSLTPVPASPQEAGIVVTWEAIASDPESDGLQYQFLLDGSPITGWQDPNQWTWETSVNEIGAHSIEARVKDGAHSPDGDSSQKVSFIIAKPNEKPSISDLSADKASPQETGSIVTWTAKASDSENDPILYRFFLNQLPTTDWQSSNKWSWTAAEGEAQIEVQVRDGKHAEQDGFDDSKIATFTVSPPNQKPAIINFSPDKQSPQETGSTITWTVESMDAENDPLQFLFSLDGQVLQDWSNSPVWSWTATKEQVGGHVIEARVRDGKHNPDGDSTSSANFEIVLPPNNAPALSSLTADRESPQLLGTAVAWTAQASDPESDPISYRFLVNGTPATDWQPENTWTWTATELLLRPKSSPCKSLCKPRLCRRKSYRPSSMNHQSLAALRRKALAHNYWEQQLPGRPRPAIRNPIQSAIASWSTARLPPTGNQRIRGPGRP